MPSLGTKTVYAEPGPPYKTAEQMTELCCEPRPKLQCREKVVGDIQPDMQKALENLGLTLDAQGRDQNGRLVKLVYKERKNPCGKIVHRYKVEQKDCCEEVEPLAIDTERSVSVLAPGTHGNVYFSGGRFPVLVKLRGNGFTLDGYNQRDGWIDGPNRGFTVFAHEFACGAAPLTLDDGCSVVRGGLRATTGVWQLLGTFRTKTLAAQVPGVWTDPTNIYKQSTSYDPLPWDIGDYLLAAVSSGLQPDLAADQWRAKTTNLNACSYIGEVYASDPVAGVFSVPIIHHSEYVGPDHPGCGGGPFFRVFYVEPENSFELGVFRWIC
ncbi:MAG: hypothetical protein RBS34_13585 [Desulfofustis sp.]|jgi:hypothetical protein|nr:hypothetical protein [Desulfofustis sp.]